MCQSLYSPRRFFTNLYYVYYPVTVTKYPRQSAYKEKRFLRVHNLRGSIWGQLFLLHWACGEAKHHVVGQTWLDVKEKANDGPGCP